MDLKKILMVVTSHDQLGSSGHATGAYLAEISHAYEEFVEAGYDVTVACRHGGEVPLDGVKMDDPINATWMNDEDFLDKIENALPLVEVLSQDYCAVYFAGGHGAMFDFPDNRDVQRLGVEIFENDGVVSAIGHGCAALVNMRLSTAEFLVKDHEVTCYSNEEEKSVGYEQVVPFLLQNKLKERGADVSVGPKFTSHVVQSGRLVTGQNPSSASELAQAVLQTIHFISTGKTLPEKNWCEWHP